MIISLIGFMGCGKSSVGRKLSQLLCCRFIDLDEVIEEVAGKSISETFAKDGEIAFRQMELEALKTIVGGWMSKTKSLPRLRRGPLPFTGPRAATVFDTPTTDNESYSTELLKCQFRPIASPISENNVSDLDSLEGASQGITEEGAVVLALGGGTVMTEECAELVRENTCCIYLRASVDTLVERLSGEAESRPLLNTSLSPSCSSDFVEERGAKHHTSLRVAQRRGNPLQERIAELLEQRAATYEKTANIIIDTDGKSIDQICFEILS